MSKVKTKAKKMPAKRIVLTADGKSLLFSSVKKSKLLTGRKFRQNPELEAFYNFVHENNLRIEARDIVVQLIENRKQKSSQKTGKKPTSTSSK